MRQAVPTGLAPEPAPFSHAVIANDILFTSGTLGRYSNTLNSVMENRRKSPGEITIPVDAIK